MTKMANPMDDIVLVGDWVKERTLGCGSFGIVVLWRHRHSNERLAIKTCRWGAELTLKHRERWTKEVEMLRNFNNENIVGTRDLPSEFLSCLERANPSRLPILCMEYCSGGDLRILLNKAESSSGLAEIHIRKILSDIKNAVEFLHKHKITHRDLKPENIVMKTHCPGEDQSRSKITYKLIDLGYAKEIDSNSVCASFVGTLQYLAPELFYSKTYSNSVDFWSFGLLVFEVICGVRPFLPHMAPVQWMPYVKKKSSDQICVFETYHGDIEYSTELFPENHLSAPFGLLLKKWLRIALEYDPKLRGRDGIKGVTFNLPSEDVEDVENKFGKVIIFSLMEEILSKKIIIVFSSYTLEMLAYEVEDALPVSTLKKWIEKDTKIPVHHQMLLSHVNYAAVNDSDYVVNYWDDDCKVMLYLYNKDDFMKENIQPKVPKPIQRCLEQPKALYNFRNSQNLYRSGMYYIQSEKELYDCLIKSCLIKAESLKVVGKHLFLKHNQTDKEFERLRTMQNVLSKTLDTNKSHIEELKTANCAMYLDHFEEISLKAIEAIEKFYLVETAWNAVTTRLTSAARRSNEINPAELLNNFVAKYNFQTLLADMSKACVRYKVNNKDSQEKPCNDIVKLSYNCLKIRDKILQELHSQPFILRILDIDFEYSKITSTIDTALENINKLYTGMSNIIDELVEWSWGVIKFFLNSKLENPEVPYSVVSFEKKQFDIGGPVTNPIVKTPQLQTLSTVTDEVELKSLIEDSLKLKQAQEEITEKLKLYTEEMNSYDFSFLEE